MLARTVERATIRYVPGQPTVTRDEPIDKLTPHDLVYLGQRV